MHIDWTKVAFVKENRNFRREIGVDSAFSYAFCCTPPVTTISHPPVHTVPHTCNTDLQTLKPAAERATDVLQLIRGSQLLNHAELAGSVNVTTYLLGMLA